MLSELWRLRETYCAGKNGKTRKQSIWNMDSVLAVDSIALSNTDRTPPIPLSRIEVADTPFESLHCGGRIRLDGKRFAVGDSRFTIRGVTYGPFAPDTAGDPFPDPATVREDFVRMRAIGVNSLRIYHPPPEWFLDLAGSAALRVQVDIPCPKNLGFLDSCDIQAEARRTVRETVARLQQRPEILAVSIGNEIPPDVVRWYGARRVERFLAELVDTAHQADPAILATYGNYPSTEYMDLPFLDFMTFNVYLHDPAVFRGYLLRLANRTGDRPLVLGELGMDTLRHGEQEQARFLAGHLQEVALQGLAGAFVFAWTDDWVTEGWPVEDWAFGLTRRDRTPKLAYENAGTVWMQAVSELLPATPRVSVVVCSYNGGRTLPQCLASLRKLDYPNYEVILVDDGSTDDTPAIAAQFPEVRTIRQENHGLSAARNVGLQAATGEIVAYTDSDCFVDPDWLALLVRQFQFTGADAVGGPNLTPDDGWLAACVAASPGQPAHVLATDEIAEHIPGCNMAIRRSALLAIGGFDVIYRQAGDDVDVCWRLQAVGGKISFAPGACVWHHRRQGPRAFLRQQAGYGEGEALLAKTHPERFNLLGNAVWKGGLYGHGSWGMRLAGPRLFRGIFGRGLFQSIYQAEPAHWVNYPTTLEWHVVAVGCAAAGLYWPGALLAAVYLFGLSLVIAAGRAWQAVVPSRYDGWSSRFIIAGLCWLQPLVRSAARWRRHMRPLQRSAIPSPGQTLRGQARHQCRKIDYMTWDGLDRTELIRRVALAFEQRRWPKVLDDGWQDWDIEVHCGSGGRLQILTAQENYPGNAALIQVAFRRRPGLCLKAAGVGTVVLGIAAIVFQSPLLLAGTGAMLMGGLALIAAGRHSMNRAVQLFDSIAVSLRLTPADAKAPQDGRAPLDGESARSNESPRVAESVAIPGVAP